MRKKTILVFDETISAQHIKTILLKLGYQHVLLISLRDELFSFLDNQIIDVFLMDVDFAMQNQMLELASETCLKKDISLVYLADHNSTWLEDNLSALDVAGYVLKPIRKRELQMGIESTIAKHRHTKEIERQLAELTFIHNISQAAASIQDINKLISYITQCVYDLFGNTIFSIALDEPELNMVSVSSFDENDANMFKQIPRDSSLIGLIIKRQQTILINSNFEMEINNYGMSREAMYMTQLPKSWLGIPIVAMGKILGAICIQDFEYENAFSQEQVNLLSLVAANISIAIFNGQLFDTLQKELVRSAEREQELEQTKQKMESVFNAMPVGLAILSKENIPIFSNPSLSKIMKLNPEQMAARVQEKRQYLLPDGSLMPEQELMGQFRMLGKQTIYYPEIGVVDESGQVTWINFHALPVDLDEWQTILVAIDITERKNIEMTFAQSEADLSEAHRIARMGRWARALPSGQLTWSEGIYSLLELDLSKQPSDAILYSAIHMDDLLDVQLAHSQVLEKNASIQISYRLVMQDGWVKWVNEICHADYNPQGHATRIVGILYDITDFKMTEEQLRLQSTALESAANAIAIFNKEHIVEWVNPAYTNLTGYKIGEIVGAHLSILQSGAHSNEFMQQIWDTLSSGAIWHGNVINQRKNGDLYQIETTITPVPNRKGEITHFVAIEQDITQRVQTEAEMRRYAEEQAALHAVATTSTAELNPTELLRTTLNVILSISHLSATCGWVLLFDEDGRVRVGASQNISAEFLTTNENNPLALCSLCTRTKQNHSIEIENNQFKCPCLPPKLAGDEMLDTHIGIPLKVGEQVLGILRLGWREPARYKEENYAMLENIGQQVSLALHHAYLYQKALQIDRLKIINQIGIVINASIEPKMLFHNMLVLACRSLGGQEGAIWLIDEHTNDLICQHEVSFTNLVESPRLVGKRLQQGDGLVGWVIEHRQTILTNDVHSDSRWNSQFDEETSFETYSILCAPLTHHENVIGVIEVINSRNGGFTNEDASLLEAITPIAAVAIQNAQLFEATRQRAEELDTLNHIGTAITSSLDKQVIINNALNRIKQLFNADFTGLMQKGVEDGTLIAYMSFPHTSQNIDKVILSAEQSHAGQVLESLQPILKANLMIDPDTPESVRTLVNNRLHALMTVPLIVVDRAIGVIEIASSQIDKYSENDLRVLQSIAFTMSVALENAQLYEDLKQSLAERERAQAYLIQSEKAAALGRLVAVVAHEINNPLQAIQGCLELFGQEMAGENRPKKLKLYLHTVENEMERIATIVRRMRDFYRPAQTALSLADLSKVILSVLELTKKQLQHNQINVETIWNKDLPLVRANADHLKQVFLNMIINAIDAMPNGGTLSVGIEAALMSQENQLNVPALKITFTDTGIGIPPDIISRLFEPFFTTKSSGTGLGLYVSTGIIQAHNGKIEVASQPNIGTTFHIFIPIGEK